ncbi:hypothetical protein JCM10213_006484 [Rhodosporidiobolus nylandii]
MDLPLPNETLSGIFAHLDGDRETLKALCLTTRGLAHVARPFLYTALPLPFLLVRGSGLVLDPAAYARFSAVTDEQASVSLKRAVRSVEFSGKGERAGRRSFPGRLEWTPRKVLDTLLETCENLREVSLADPLAEDLADELGALPSTSSLDSLSLRTSSLSLEAFESLTADLAPSLISISLRIGKVNEIYDLALFPNLRDLSLKVPHEGRRAVRPLAEKMRLSRLTSLDRVDITFTCTERWSCCVFWRPPTPYSWAPGGPDYYMLGKLPDVCEAKDWELVVNGREVPRRS